MDLSKAFDFAIREILLGWRQGFDGDELEHLVGIGLSEKDAFDLMRGLLENECVLEH